MSEKKLPISVFLITQDEEDRLPKALASVSSWVDEVIVVDSGSQDSTLKIAKEMGASTYFRTWEGYGPQKVWAEAQCRHNWVLNIDADEALSPALTKEIQDLFKDTAPKQAGFKLRIADMRRFAKQPGRFSAQHNRLRLYRKDACGFKDSTVHDAVVPQEASAAIGQLEGLVYHRTFRSYTHAVDKINGYTSMLAEDMVSRGRKVSTLRLITEPFTAFLKGYFIKRHCMLGVEGVFEATLFAFARTLRLAKARELWRQQQDDAAPDKQK
jgi:glycosyltransferase involved in cell wall biosynthesis